MRRADVPAACAATLCRRRRGLSAMTQDELKKAVATAAVEFVVPGQVLGVGTGSTVDFFIDALAAARVPVSAAVSSSERSTRRLRDSGIRVVDLNEVEEIAVYVDGADEIDASFSM